MFMDSRPTLKWDSYSISSSQMLMSAFIRHVDYISNTFNGPNLFTQSIEETVIKPKYYHHSFTNLSIVNFTWQQLCKMVTFYFQEGMIKFYQLSYFYLHFLNSNSSMVCCNQQSSP